MKGTARAATRTKSGKDVTLFISYSHNNKVWMDRLMPLLRSIPTDDRAPKRASLDTVSAWHDNRLVAGDKWDDEIRESLNKMSIFVPLISFDFFASEYIRDVEMKIAKARYAKGEIEIAPIMLEQIDLRQKNKFLHQFQLMPKHDRHWGQFNPRTGAMCHIDRGLWAVIEKVLNKPGVP